MVAFFFAIVVANSWIFVPLWVYIRMNVSKEGIQMVVFLNNLYETQISLSRDSERGRERERKGRLRWSHG